MTLTEQEVWWYTERLPGRWMGMRTWKQFKQSAVSHEHGVVVCMAEGCQWSMTFGTAEGMAALGFHDGTTQETALLECFRHMNERSLREAPSSKGSGQDAEGKNKNSKGTTKGAGKHSMPRNGGWGQAPRTHPNEQMILQFLACLIREDWASLERSGQQHKLKDWNHKHIGARGLWEADRRMMAWPWNEEKGAKGSSRAMAQTDGSSRGSSSAAAAITSADYRLPAEEKRKHDYRKQKLRAFYSKYNPEKLPDVAQIMDENPDLEELNAALLKEYGADLNSVGPAAEAKATAPHLVMGPWGLATEYERVNGGRSTTSAGWDLSPRSQAWARDPANPVNSPAAGVAEQDLSPRSRTWMRNGGRWPGSSENADADEGGGPDPRYGNAAEYATMGPDPYQGLWETPGGWGGARTSAW